MRGAVSIEGVRKAYGDVVAVDGVSLEVEPGEFLTLLGPSGCGKTTLLRLLAGFEQPDEGRILISGRDVAGVPPHERPVNTVFQHYALFPHRTVAGNVAFGLEARGRPRSEIDERVARALEMVRLEGLGDRGIAQLSGGQKQRVALARAVVLEPEVLLLDEPMGALDLKLRKEMQVEVKNLQERLRTTFVFVTHDQEEALIMSDRIAVMSHGRIEQLDRTEVLYERPRTRFAADFLGVRNILEVTVVGRSDGHVTLRTAGGLVLRAADDGGYVPGAVACVGIRPERLGLDAPASDGDVVARGAPRRRDLPGRPDRLARPGGGGGPDRRRVRLPRPRPPARRTGPRLVSPRGRPPARGPVRSRRQAILLLLPALAVLVGLFVVPQAFMFVASLWQRSTYGGLEREWTLLNYLRAVEPLYLWILVRSLALATATTLLCLLAGWPVAWWLGVVGPAPLEERPPGPRHPPVLDELPREDVRLDLHPPRGGPPEPAARGARAPAPAPPLQRLRGDAGTGLRRAALHDPAALRLDREARPLAPRGRRRPRRHALRAASGGWSFR